MITTISKPSKLHLAPGLELPEQAVTQTFAILGKRGSGKTNTAVVMAEEMLAKQYQAVIVDPLDVWWGLRSSRDAYLQRLAARKLIEAVGPGTVRASPQLFG